MSDINGESQIENPDEESVRVISAPIPESIFTKPAFKPTGTLQRIRPKIGRNEPCPCNSGKKFKRCHGAKL